MKTQRIKLYRLQNEEWFQHGTDLKALLTRYDPAALSVQPQYTRLVGYLRQADEALELARKSAYTPAVTAADERRDHNYRRLLLLVKGELLGDQAARVEAAGQVQVILDRYAHLDQQNYNKESAEIYNLVQDLNAADAKPAVTLLGLADAVSRLNTANNDFKKILGERFDAEVGQTTQRMKEVRKIADPEIKEILDFVDVFNASSGAQVYRDFIAAYNIRAEYYARTIAEREGRNAAKKEKEAADPEFTPPSE
jgi:hypothetical protein